MALNLDSLYTSGILLLVCIDAFVMGEKKKKKTVFTAIGGKNERMYKAQIPFTGFMLFSYFQMLHIVKIAPVKDCQCLLRSTL